MDNFETQLNQGITHFEDGDDNAARDIFEHLINNFPDRAEGYYWLGRVQCNQRIYDNAVQSLNRAIEIDPQLANAYRWRSFALLSIQRYVQGFEDIIYALQLEPENPEFYNARAGYFYGMRDYGEVVADTTHAIDLDPTYPDAYLGRGMVYFSAGNYERALPDLLKYKELAGDKAQSTADTLISQIEIQYGGKDHITAPGFFRKVGRAFYGRGNYQRAIEELSRGIQYRRTSENYLDRAAAYLLLDQYDNALEDLNIALELKPNSVEVLSNRGLAYFKLNRLDSALVDFSNAIAQQPNDPILYANRGEVYAKLNHLDAAYDDLTRYMETVRGQPLPKFVTILKAVKDKRDLF